MQVIEKLADVVRNLTGNPAERKRQEKHISSSTIVLSSPEDERKDAVTSSPNNPQKSDERERPPNHATIGAWMKYNRGFAAKYMEKLNYGGKGLGKNEDGIIEPVTVQKKTVLGIVPQKQTSSSSITTELNYNDHPRKNLLHNGCKTTTIIHGLRTLR